MNEKQKPTALILGATGKIGQHSASAFEEAGWIVKKYNRHEENMNDAAKNVDVIINGLNPPNYQNWEENIPKITRDVISAAKMNNAMVIIPGNVYHFGDQGGVWSEKTVPKPISRKGEIRLSMEETYKKSGVKTLVLRAGNFIDPNRQGCPMSSIYLRSIANYKITLPGPSTTTQAMCYLPDWARAAVQLAQKRSDLAQFEDIPFQGHTLTAEIIKYKLERILDRELKVNKFPWWLFTLTAPIWELARELNEMRYLWHTDHTLSNERFKILLPNFKSTDLESLLISCLPPKLRNDINIINH